MGTGDVDLATVIRVLTANEVSVSREENGEKPMYVVAKGEALNVLELPQKVDRRMLQFLQRTYGVPIHQFYNPLMAPPLPGEKVQ